MLRPRVHVLCLLVLACAWCATAGTTVRYLRLTVMETRESLSRTMFPSVSGATHAADMGFPWRSAVPVAPTLSELVLYAPDGSRVLPAVSSYEPAATDSGANPLFLVDADTTTVWKGTAFDAWSRTPAWVVFDFGEPLSLGSYELIRSSDAAVIAGDPTSWLLEGGDELDELVVLDSRSRAVPPTAASSSYGQMALSPCGEAAPGRWEIPACARCHPSKSWRCVSCSPGFSNTNAWCPAKAPPTCTAASCVHGTCQVSPRHPDLVQCTCDMGWIGHDCSRSVLPDNPSCGVTGCHADHGTCVYQADVASAAFVCRCNTGFAGADCSRLVAASVAETALAPSSGLNIDTDAIEITFSEPLRVLPAASTATVHHLAFSDLQTGYVHLLPFYLPVEAPTGDGRHENAFPTAAFDGPHTLRVPLPAINAFAGTMGAASPYARPSNDDNLMRRYKTYHTQLQRTPDLAAALASADGDTFVAQTPLLVSSLNAPRGYCPAMPDISHGEILCGTNSATGSVVCRLACHADYAPVSSVHTTSCTWNAWTPDPQEWRDDATTPVCEPLDPLITGVSPSYALPIGVATPITLVGRHLGRGPDDVIGVDIVPDEDVSGVAAPSFPCASAVRVAHDQITCVATLPDRGVYHLEVWTMGATTPTVSGYSLLAFNGVTVVDNVQSAIDTLIADPDNTLDTVHVHRNGTSLGVDECDILISSHTKTRSLWIVGNPNEPLATFDCAFAKRAFRLAADRVLLSHMRLEAMRITSKGGGIYVTGSDVTLDSVVMYQCIGPTHGGCVYINAPNFLAYRAHYICSISKKASANDVAGQLRASNSGATVAGGAMYFDDAASGARVVGITAELCAVFHVPSLGGAIAVAGPAQPITIQGSTFINNGVLEHGGHIALESHTDTSSPPLNIIDGNSFRFGQALSRGGAIHVADTSALITNNLIKQNEAADVGGGIMLYYTTASDSQTMLVTLTGNTFQGNLALSGAGVGWEEQSGHPKKNVDVLLQGNYYRDNVGSFGGGVGIQADTHDMRIVEEHFDRNAAGILGGGIFLSPLSTLTVVDTLFENNFSIQNGGGIFVYGNGTAWVSNCQFLSNECLSQGGAIHAIYGHVFVDDCYFFNNSASARGGAFSFIDSQCLLTNSVVTTNSATMGGGMELQSSLVTVSNVLFTKNRCDNAGAGIIADVGTSLTVTNITATHNTAGISGGFATVVHISLDTSTLAHNSAQSGGAIHVEAQDARTVISPPLHATSLRFFDHAPFAPGVNISGVHFAHNAAASGGALHLASDTQPVWVSASTFASNTAPLASQGKGGDIYVAPGTTTSPIHVQRVVCADSTALRGGSLYVSSGGALRVTNITLTGAQGTYGGALAVAEGGTLILTDAQLAHTSADEGGAGHVMGHLRLHDVRVHHATALLSGGGFYVSASAQLNWTDVAISECLSMQDGGAFAFAGIPSSVTFAGVSARDSSALGGGGGGLYLCFQACGADPVPLTDPALGVLTSQLASTGNTALYGDQLASSITQLRWSQRPLVNQSMGAPVVAPDDRVPELRLSDLFDQTVPNTDASQLRVATIEILLPTGDPVPDQLLYLDGPVKQIASDAGEVAFSDIEVVVNAQAPASMLDTDYQLRVALLDNSIHTNTPIHVASCPAGAEPVVITTDIECSQCLPGRSALVGFDAQCVPCDPGTYAAEAGAHVCDLCPAGTFSAAAAAVGCAQCPQGEYSLPGATDCTVCPQGGACEFGTLVPQAGWYDPQHSSSARTSDTFYKCPNPKACTPEGCAEHYEGVLCDRCERHDGHGNIYAKVGRTCSKCPEMWVNYLLIAIGAIAVLAISLYFIRAATKSKSEISILLKILIDYMQLMALTGEFNRQAASTLTRFFNFTRTATTSVNVFPVMCVREYHYYDVFLFYAALPVVSVGICAAAYAIIGAVRWSRLQAHADVLRNRPAEQSRTNTRRPRNTSANASGEWGGRGAAANTHALRPSPSALLSSEYDRQMRMLRKTLRKQFVSTLTVIYFLAYPSVVKNIFSVFPCYQDLNRLKADVAIQCYTSEHVMYTTAAAVLLFVYCLLIPGVGFFYFRSYAWPHDYQPSSSVAAKLRADTAFRETLGNEELDRRVQVAPKAHLVRTNAMLFVRPQDNPRLEQFMFLIDGFRPHTIYWEMVTVTRKTCVVVILVFFGDSATTQSLFGLVCIFVFALLHLMMKPYVAKPLNVIEFGSLLMLLVNLLGSLAWVADKDGGEMSLEVALILIAVNSIFLLAIITYAIRFLILHHRTAKRRSQRLQESRTRGLGAVHAAMRLHQIPHNKPAIVNPAAEAVSAVPAYVYGPNADDVAGERVVVGASSSGDSSDNAARVLIPATNAPAHALPQATADGRRAPVQKSLAYIKRMVQELQPLPEDHDSDQDTDTYTYDSEEYSDSGHGPSDVGEWVVA